MRGAVLAWSVVLAAALGGCGGPRGPWAAGVSAVVADDSAVFVMPSGWQGSEPPPPRGVTSRLDYGWSVEVPSPERYSISAHRFTTDAGGTAGTPLERLLAPSRICLCEQRPNAHAHAHQAQPPPRVPRQVTVRARGDHVVLTLKAAPAVQAVFGSRPTHVWFKRWRPWPRADSVRVLVRYTGRAAPAAADVHQGHVER
ncbi:MAG TPA: hypothetical protein VGB15_19305 [Longimicrobium sp.]|jgi:hypothetical protein